MKKLAILLIIATTFFACKKDNETKPLSSNEPNGTVIFYKSPLTKYNTVLIWEGIEKDSLMASDTIPLCGTSGFITMDVPPGKYNIDFKSYSMNLISDPRFVIVTSGKCNTYLYR